jgi:UDPglucose 6-dehydrogenase
MTLKVAYAGMTHLGLCSAVAAASKGFPTLCFDPDPERIAALSAGKLPVVEPGLDDLFSANAARLTFSSDLKSLGTPDLIYVAPDVPTDDHGGSDLGPMESLLSLIKPNLGQNAVTVILSQVPPGFSRAHAFPDQPFYYQVETLVFGRAVERATEPERFIVGTATPGNPLPPAMATFLQSFDCPILEMCYESAELAKISINCCLVASVTVANTLAEVCERIGADWSEIAPALKLDRRIGEFSYLSAGLGISGGNLERDLTTVNELALTHGTDASLITAFQHNSAHRKDWPLRELHRTVLDIKTDPVIGILGLAYKENTHSTKNSPALALLAHLHPWSVRHYDPVVATETTGHPRATGCASALETAAGVDALVLMTPWPEFRDLDAMALSHAMRGRVIIDPYRLISPDHAVATGLQHVTLGTK